MIRAALNLGTLAVLLLGTAACRRGEAPPVDPSDISTIGDFPRADSVRSWYLRGLDSLVAASARLEATADSNPAVARRAFRVARVRYKTVEAFVEYYSPVTARAVNGPVLMRSEENEGGAVIEPTGFQVIEAALFPESSKDWAQVVSGEGRRLQVNGASLASLAKVTAPTDGHAFDAFRLELARILTLGLSGFDASLSGYGVAEATVALEGVRTALEAYLPGAGEQRDSGDSTMAALARAAEFLRANADPSRLDRIEFVASFAGPAAHALDRFRKALGVELPQVQRVWSAAAPSLFDPGAFDARALAPEFAPVPTVQLVELGRDLFFDPVLSGDGTRTCAFCHQPEKAFSDGRPRRLAVGAERIGVGRNTPTLINAGLQPGSFFDQRTTYLEDQVTAVVADSAEMAHSVEAAARRVEQSGVYAERFRKAFGREGRATSQQLRIAVAAYVRSLQALNSPFDRAIRGDTAGFDPAARRGFVTFMGKAKCGTCHFAPLFNGATPPSFTEAEPEVIGTTVRPPAEGRPELDPDLGRGAVNRVALQLRAFKTPTLRNIALTAPYFHNGAFATLEEVVDFYDRGGAVGLGLELPNQTLPPEPLRLTPPERADLVAFMKALTDTTATQPPRR